MKTLGAVLFLALTLSVAGSAADLNGDNHEIILLPFAFGQFAEVPGAYGTIWTGELWIESRNPGPVKLGSCGLPQVCDVDPNFAMRYVGNPLSGEYPPQFGLLLVLPHAEAQNITFSNRIFERTLRSQPRGVDVPAVREGEFFVGQQTFLGVPSDAGVRVSLRLYDPWVHFPQSARPTPVLESVAIELLDPRQRSLGRTTLTLAVPNPADAALEWHKPAFGAIYDLASVFPRALDEPYVHIRVTAQPAAAQWWGMVSVTDNATQTVSIITAQ